MEKFLTLTCPSCGGKLQITQDVDRFACSYCGVEHIVKRGGGIVSIAPVIESLKRVQEGTDKTASELAIVRLQKEIQSLLEETYDAILAISYDRDAREKLKKAPNNFFVGFKAGMESVDEQINKEIHSFLIQKGRRQKVYLSGLVPWENLQRALFSLTAQEFQDMESYIRDILPRKKGRERKACEQILNGLARLIPLTQLLQKKKTELEKHEQIISQ